MTVSPRGVPLGAGRHDAVSLAAGGVRYCVRRFGTHTPGRADSGADSEAGGTAGAHDDGVGAAPRPAVRAVPAVPAALLLHDLAGGLGDWDVLAGELVADRAALAVSPKGLGASEGREPYTGDALAAELAALVLHAVDGRVDVVGHGTGATVAWNLAARRPDLVRRVVLISGGRALSPWRAASIILGDGMARGGASEGTGPGGETPELRVAGAPVTRVAGGPVMQPTRGSRSAGAAYARPTPDSNRSGASHPNKRWCFGEPATGCRR